jgi:hypothetical protein
MKSSSSTRPDVLYGLRYLEGRDDANTAELKRFVEHDLHYLDYRDTLAD